jgi:hypothetical protein
MKTDTAGHHPKVKTTHPPSLWHPPANAHARINHGWRGGSERAYSSRLNCSLMFGSTNPVGYSWECTSHRCWEQGWLEPPGLRSGSHVPYANGDEIRTATQFLRVSHVEILTDKIRQDPSLEGRRIAC